MADITQNPWAQANQHVDPTISTTGFTNSAHVIIYAKIHGTTDTFKALGAIQGWSFTEQRQTEEAFELGSDIRYIVPGRTSGQLAITRLLINGADLLNTVYGKTNLGDKPIRSLKDINRAVDLMFVAFTNGDPLTNTTNPASIIRYFDNCWIVARQESIGANQVIIAENCTISYERQSTLTVNPVGTDGVVTLTATDNAE